MFKSPVLLPYVQVSCTASTSLYTDDEVRWLRNTGLRRKRVFCLNCFTNGWKDHPNAISLRTIKLVLLISLQEKFSLPCFVYYQVHLKSKRKAIFLKRNRIKITDIMFSFCSKDDKSNCWIVLPHHMSTLTFHIQQKHHPLLMLMYKKIRYAYSVLFTTEFVNFTIAKLICLILN